MLTQGSACHFPRAEPFAFCNSPIENPTYSKSCTPHAMAQTALGRLTTPVAIALISFLAYGSQILFYYIEPSPLAFQEALVFNILVAFIWVTYARACLTNVGWVPNDWSPGHDDSTRSAVTPLRRRWCRKCEAVKPPRAHHCKICARCVPKMDHHCPWPASCVSHRTFPHFIRFLFYSVVTMFYLAYFLYIRGTVLWEGRNLPSVSPKAGNY